MKKTSEKITKLSLLAAILFAGHVAYADNVVADEQSKGTAQTAADAQAAAGNAEAEAGKAQAAAGNAEAAAGDAQVTAGKAQAAAAKAQGAVVHTIAAKPAIKAPAKKPVAHHKAPVKHVVAAAHVPAPVAVIAAMPEPVKEPIALKLGISGEFTPEIGIVSNTALNTNLPGYDLGWNNLKLVFTPSVKTEGGAFFSGTLRYDMTSLSPATFSPTITRLYATIGHEKIGKIIIGNNYGLTYLSQKAHQDITGGIEGFDRNNLPTYYVGLPTGSYGANSTNTISLFDQDVDPRRNQKISIVTAKFAGLSLGATFVPLVGPSSNETGGNLIYNNVINGASSKNMWFIVPTFDQKFGDFAIGLMGSYGQATALNGAGLLAPTLDNPQLWSLSTTLSYRGFDIGGAYSNSGTSLLNAVQKAAGMAKGTGWVAAAGYTIDSFRLALEYMSTSKAWDSTTNGLVSAYCFTAYAGYTVVPGVTFYLSNNYVAGTNATSTLAKANLLAADLTSGSDQSGNILFIGMDLSF